MDRFTLINKVLRYDNIEDKLENVPDPVELTEAFNLPPDQHHGWKFLAFGPDGKLYVPVGAPCNICEVDPGTHAQKFGYDVVVATPASDQATVQPFMTGFLDTKEDTVSCSPLMCDQHKSSSSGL